MSKKLPGLNRRAPKIFDAAESQTKSIPEPRAKSKPRSGPTKRKKTILIVEKLSFDQEERIENEDLLPESSTVEIDQRVAKAMIIVGQRSNWAMAGGMLPIPMIDAAIIIGVQLSMVKKLSALYNVPFHRNRAHAIVMALIGGLLPYMAGAGLASLLGKSIPVLGWGISIAAVSILAGATTHATGVVFIQHYESGGTLFNFDPAATRDFYRQEFENARQEKTPAA
jgi:uncharacterized protein (DUF697 family)